MSRFGVVTIALFLFAQTAWAQISSRHVRNYGPELTRTGESFGATTIDHHSIVYFASEKGVVAFDGESWHVIMLDGGLGVRALQYDSIRKRVWVGGIGTFGYVAYDSKERFRYVSISDSLLKQKHFKQVWQIMVEKNAVTFMTNEAHFRLADGRFEIDRFENTYLFPVGDRKYYSRRQGTLSIEHNGVITEVWDHSKAIREAIFFVAALSNHQDLLFTPYDGVFIFDEAGQKVSRYNTPLSKLLRDRPLYDALLLNDSLLAIATWYHGVLLTDLKGNLIDQCTTKNGLLSDGISDLALDASGKLWLATDYGISVIDLKAAWPRLFSARPTHQSIVTQLTVNNDSNVYNFAADREIQLERKPENVAFHFATPGLEYLEAHTHWVKLDGRDTTWISMQDKNTVEYANLPNGAYTFRTKTESPLGTSVEGKFLVHINEPWYAFAADNWRYLVTGASITLLMAASLTYRLRSAKKSLTEKVAEKTKAIAEHERELLSMNKNLREANEELDILLYRSSHDLIAPVKSIKGLLNLMRLSPGDHATYVPLMEDRINRLESILLEINSYIKNVKGEPTITTFNGRELIDEIWRELEFMEEATEIDHVTDVTGDLIISCDRGRLKMALGNLVSNAVKYHDKRKSNRFIRVSIGTEQQAVRITVEDNGQGIRKEYQARLFEMFYRATEGSSGLGLGLFLVKKIIDSLGGSLRLDSTHGIGTRVEVRIPATYQQRQPSYSEVLTN